MSADSHAGHGDALIAPGHGSAHSSGHGDDQAHGSLKTYLIGFGLSVILTAVPFWLVMTGALHGKQATVVAITALAVVQIVVHMVCFLHMSPKSEDGWTLTALVFTVILVAIALIGSIWVMYHLNTNMMPQVDMSQMP